MPGQNPLTKKSTIAVGLPPIVFFYTIDQIATILNISEDTVRSQYLYYVGRTPGRKSGNHMEAINIASTEEKPDWRISMTDFIRWLRRKGFKIHGLVNLS